MVYIFNGIIFFNIFHFILLSTEEFIENPMKIINYSEIDDYIIDLEAKYFPLNSNTILIILKDKIEIKYVNQLFYLSQNFLLCQDQSNNYFLFYKFKYYKIIRNNDIIVSLNYIMELPSNVKYNGFIKEKEFNVDGVSSKIIKDEIVLYGKQEQNLYFKYIKESTDYIININNIGEQISCKFLRSSRYACAYFIEDKLYVSTFLRKYISNDNKEFTILDTKQVNECQNYDKLILYDTDEEFYKILCCSKMITEKKKCYIIYAKVSQDDDGETIKKDLQIKNINSDYTVSLSKIHNCYFSDFYDEFLLCCGKNNLITCYRNNINNFNLINKFSIYLSGDISNVIISNKVNHAIISYKNESSNKNYLYNYYIYPPKCKDISKIILSYQSFVINLLDLFENKTNTKYYIRFHNLPTSFGIIKIGEKNITSIDSRIELKPERDKLYFFSNSYQGINISDIIYNISIEETYSSLCKISLTINECYHSCKGCYYDINNSNNTNHNCINCKEEYNYFHYSEQQKNNCYNEQEMKENFQQWYFNESKKIFEKCHLMCKTCYGANIDNCLSCMDENSYAYQGKCILNCPIGTFGSKDKDGNKICQNCYSNCASCEELGNSTDMKCSSCSGDKIKYRHNCLIIYDNETKSFYNPNSQTGIVTSCLQHYDKYIIVNTNACIDMPKKGYYVSNNFTGLLSPCYFSCKTCSNKIINNNSNCIECADDYYRIFGENLNNCYSNETINKGYFLDTKINSFNWKKCHENCEECYGLGNSTNMNCLSCKKNLSNFYTLKLTTDGNCIKQCKNNLFLTSFGHCMKTCPNGTYQYILNYTCLENCPNIESP